MSNYLVEFSWSSYLVWNIMNLTFKICFFFHKWNLRQIVLMNSSQNKIVYIYPSGASPIIWSMKEKLVSFRKWAQTRIAKHFLFICKYLETMRDLLWILDDSKHYREEINDSLMQRKLVKQLGIIVIIDWSMMLTSLAFTFHINYTLRLSATSSMVVIFILTIRMITFGRLLQWTWESTSTFSVLSPFYWLS